MTAAAQSDSRQRLIDAALGLFIRHSFAGTSLQMIADELGVTKAAVYHHFRTREALLRAVIEPLIGQLRDIIEAAEGHRTPNARADHILCGYAALAVRNRDLIAMVATDPAVIEMLRTHPDLADLIGRQVRLFADVDPGPAGLVRAAMVLAGIAGASGKASDAGSPAARIAEMTGRSGFDIDDDFLCEHLIEAGRRVLGLRAPRRLTSH